MHVRQARHKEPAGSVNDNCSRWQPAGRRGPDRFDRRPANHDGLCSKDSVAIHWNDRNVVKHDRRRLRDRRARQDRARGEQQDNGKPKAMAVQSWHVVRILSAQ